jgi:transcriptional regulator with XRE-family HTH domain
MKASNQPFLGLGTALRELRVKYRKTPVEVSGAIEVEVDRLLDYEAGKHRPSEDILLLLIQHFDLEDIEAKKLWQLAGYKTSFDGEFIFDNDEAEPDSQLAKTVVVSPHDIRIVYTDMVQVTVNNYGVVMNFLQSSGVGNQPLAVSRIGMSKEHAKSIVEVLVKTLEQADEKNGQKQPPKRLSSSSQE